jgi:nucleoside-diphosphate-sugar epimerase
MRMNNILVLGGSGFLGSSLISHFKKIGWNVTGTSRSGSNGLVKFDLKNRKMLGDLLATNQYSVLINLVGNASHPKTRGLDGEQRAMLFEQFTFAQKELQNLEKAIHIGSCAEYGVARLPYSEKSSPLPDSEYGKGKLMETNFFISMAQDGLPISILRPSIVFGAFQSGNMLVPRAIRQMMQGQEIALNEPDRVRDFLYIKDFTNAVESSIRHGIPDGRIHNLGSGTGIRVRDFVSELGNFLLAVSSENPESASAVIEHEPEIEVDISLAKLELKWEPVYPLGRAMADLVYDLQSSLS